MARRKAWLTPDDIPAATRCRILILPDDDVLYANVLGALLPMTYEENWEAYGAATPAEAAEAMRLALDALVTSDCEAFCMPDESIWIHQETQGTAGGGLTANTDTICKFPTQVGGYPDWIEWNTGHTLRIQSGQYRLSAWHNFFGNGGKYRMWFGYNGGASILIEGGVFDPTINMSFINHIDGYFTLAAETICAVYARGTVTRANDHFGRAYNQADRPEIYGVLSIIRIGD